MQMRSAHGRQPLVGPQLVGGLGEAIPKTAHRANIARVRRVGLDLGAQPANVYIHSARITLEIVAPDMFQQHLARERHAAIVHQAGQQVKLFLPQV